ncbi:hypothetical protein DFQ28_009814 [Apophysomyces sp. BC1034]|nr:hypothetical protein DFQ30_009522 [Apophysomyces sp. BC1015]KAG0192240.1 hypothetical protein DFQ28_009814 [Apophysomyces sp. BC1034]
MDTWSIIALVFMVGLFAIALISGQAFLPAHASKIDRLTFIWFAFDALTHFIIEGSFLYHSTFGRTVLTGTGLFADMWKDYAQADLRWGFADSTIVAVELMTVVFSGSMCLYVLYLLHRNDPTRHLWIIVLSVFELIGGWFTFVPEWLDGSKYLTTDNFLYLYIYLAFFNLLWVVIPVALSYRSYNIIVGSLRKNIKSE